MAEIIDIPINEIVVGEHEQRMDREDEGISELSSSIIRLGVILPLIVQSNDTGYRLVSGHRRLAAAKKANLKTVPCIVRSDDSTQESEVVFAENFFRKDLSPVELACAIKDTLEKKTMSVGDVAIGFHRSESWVHRMLAITTWPEDVQMVVHSGALSMSAASNLALVTDDIYRDFLLRQAVEQGATARTTAAWLQSFQSMQPPEQAITAEPVPSGHAVIPLVPQSPCYGCGRSFELNRLSHIPFCYDCIQSLRQAGVSPG